jgi:hypothetical protein
MLDDPDVLEFDPPDVDRVCRNFLRTCEILGVEQVPRNRAQDLMAEWADAITAGRSGPPPTHQPHRMP